MYEKSQENRIEIEGMPSTAELESYAGYAKGIYDAAQAAELAAQA